MGLGIGDFNLDGNLDIFKTHFADDTNVLYRNDGKGIFDDVTYAARVWPSRRATSAGAPASSISITTVCPDLFVVTGGVYPEVAKEACRNIRENAARRLSQSRQRQI